MWNLVGFILLAWLGGLLLSLTFGGWIVILPVIAVLLSGWKIARSIRRRNSDASDAAKANLI